MGEAGHAKVMHLLTAYLQASFELLKDLLVIPKFWDRL